MNSTVRTALALAAAITAAGCTVHASEAPAAPAIPAAEQSAITAIAAHCTGTRAQLAAEISATRQIEVKGGVKDESVTQLAGHLATIVSAYGSKRVNCVDAFAAYATERTGGKVG